MAKDVIMPVLGMNQDTAVLLSWLKQEGEHVEQGEPIMEVETDKATMALDAPASGTLARVTAAAGDEVKVGSVIAVILGSGEAPAEATPGAATDASPGPDGAAEPAPAGATAAPAGASFAAAVADRTGPYRLTPASPKARRLASEHALDVAELEGSGPLGAVLAADVLRAAQRGPRAAPAPLGVQAGPGAWTEFVREVDAAPLLAVVTWARGRAHGRGDGPTGSHLTGVDVGDLLARFLAAVWARHPLLDAGAGSPLRYRRVTDGAVSDAHLDDAAAAGIGGIVSARQAAGETDASPGAATLSLLDLTRARADLSADGAPHEGVVSLVAGRLDERVLAVAGVPEVRTTLTLRLAFDRSRVTFGAAAGWADQLLELVEDPSALALLY